MRRSPSDEALVGKHVIPGGRSVEERFAPPFIRSPYNYDRAAASRSSGVLCLDKSLTQQQFTEEVDINAIVDRFSRGVPLPLSSRVPRYGDFTGIPDYHSALTIVTEARTAFMELPASLRARFDNDPGLFLQFVADPVNEPELIKLGIALPRVPPVVKDDSVDTDGEVSKKPPVKASKADSRGDKGE